jgi:hypothetical protein
MRPRSADTSEPACVKRKMLSTKRSTSWPSLVAEVLGDREGREGDAGARARRLVHLAVDQRGLGDDGLAGLERLLHLEVEVVALAGALADAGEQDTPPCALATLLMSSMMRTVLPTPAPPKRPILPPLLVGARGR